MIYEFAVFPGLFNSEDRITALRGLFGIEAGRLVSDFPQKQWAALAAKVIEKSAPNPDERKKWTAALIDLVKRASYRRQGASWDKDLNWIENAVEEHKRRPFRGILHNERSTEAAVIRFGVDIAQHLNWNSPASCHRPRRAHEMVQTIAPMLELSTTLVLVDPHFWAVDRRWQNFLLSLATLLSASSIRPKIEHIHYIVRTDDKMSVQETEREFRRFLEPDLPPGISVGFYLVLPAVLHDRFVLTDRAGIQFGHGLDEGSGDVLITRLGEEAYEKEWDKTGDIRSGRNPAVRHKFVLRKS